MRVPLRTDHHHGHVVVQFFSRDKIYVNIQEFYRHDLTKKWMPGKKDINLTLANWNVLMDASTNLKIYEAVQGLDRAIQEKAEH